MVNDWLLIGLLSPRFDAVIAFNVHLYDLMLGVHLVIHKEVCILSPPLLHGCWLLSGQSR